MATRAELLRLIEQTLLQTEARTALRALVNGVQDNIDAGGGGGGGPQAAKIFAQLVTANSTTLIVGTDFTAIVPYDMTLDALDEWVMTSDDTCSVVVDVQRATVAAPTTFASIAASAKPTLTADTYNTGAMTGWSTSLLKGERVRLVVETASGTDKVQVMIPAEKT
jgi:hypothetical protein